MFLTAENVQEVEVNQTTCKYLHTHVWIVLRWILIVAQQAESSRLSRQE